MGAEYLILRVADADLPVLRRWRAAPQVRRWWGEPSVEDDAEKLADPRIAMWVASWQGRPFAFIQDYDVHAWADHHFGYLPAPARGMDVYIGEADLIGLGHGSSLVRQHVEQLFRRGIRAVGIDPHPDNTAAQKAFEKAGFNARTGPVETAWNSAILMDQFA
jgi:aminoglycoside 6'-N-acetyltransferase